MFRRCPVPHFGLLQERHPESSEVHSGSSCALDSGDCPEVSEDIGVQRGSGHGTKFEIEYIQFTKIVVEAADMTEAEHIAAAKKAEDISPYDPHEYDIWSVVELG